jgi:hypothetical protein
MIYVRFAHLLDEQRRKELMIIYGEDVALPDDRRRGERGLLSIRTVARDRKGPHRKGTKGDRAKTN